jgi:hypothetical protein
MKTLLLAGGIAAASLPGPALAVDGFYWLLEPPVVLASAPEPVLLTVRCPAPLPTAASFEPADGGPPRALTALDGETWQTTLTPKELLFGYLPDDVNRNFVGRVRLTVPGGPDALHAIFVNVLDAQIPPVGVRTVSPDLRCSPHVVNVRLYGADPLGTTSVEEAALRRRAIRRLYESFSDRYDMVNVVLALPRRTENRTHFNVKNQVSGIGLPIFDNSAFYGSAGRLMGVNQFPLDSNFDLTEGAVHEIGHQWINSLDQPLLATGVPHWPPSDMANGVMGYSLAGGQGGTFNYKLIFQSPGQYLVQASPTTREYTWLDLYLMGLLPPASVPPFVVTTAPIGDIVHGAIVPGTVLTVDDVIATDGPREPPAAPSMTLKVATVVATRQRLLTRAEMAFFDYFAARGESTVPVPFSLGFEKGIAKPFRVATGGRGTLDARIPCPLPRPVPSVAVPAR